MNNNSVNQELLTQFVGMTNTDPATAKKFLEMSAGNLEYALQSFFDNPQKYAKEISGASTAGTAP